MFTCLKHFLVSRTKFADPMQCHEVGLLLKQLSRGLIVTSLFDTQITARQLEILIMTIVLIDHLSQLFWSWKAGRARGRVADTRTP